MKLKVLVEKSNKNRSKCPSNVVVGKTGGVKEYLARLNDDAWAAISGIYSPVPFSVAPNSDRLRVVMGEIPTEPRQFVKQSVSFSYNPIPDYM